MAEYTQQDREVAIATTLGDDVLLFKSMVAAESLGQLFRYDLTLLSEEQINFADIVGQNATVRIELPNDETRYFNGYVSRFTQTGFDGRLVEYEATLVPWLWFLTRTADCRIYQEMTVPDIIKQVFGDHGFTDIDDALGGSYRTWEYCVQYRETTFNFVSRLMEQEGIYYFFEHENGKHTLVLADSYSSHEAVPGYEQIPYYPPDEHVLRERDHISGWTVVQQVQPGGCVLNDFDFKAPKKNLIAKSVIQREHAAADFEVFDYPGEYKEASDGDAYAKVRIEELQAQYEILNGAGNARGLQVGGLFELTGFPREDQNRQYLIVSATHRLESDVYESTGGESGPTYSCDFTAIDAQQPYRPPRVTPKPVIQGPQTAIVVGKSGEEIWTDEHGRVKVQFHWDRYGKADENSSCWIRVAHDWAGKKWGAFYLPRIGHEVIVSFLEGDPDRPIITGRVYNGLCVPPYKLPDNATRSTLKSLSSKGGGGFNEFRIEDKKGEEQIFFHAEKNQDVRVKNDNLEWVGNDRHLIVKANQLELVEGNKHLTVKSNFNEKVDGTISIEAGKDMQQKVGANHALDAGQEIHLKGGMKVIIEAGMQLTMKGPGGFVDIGPAGVTIQGTMVKINSGGAAGSGSGSAPEAPEEPAEADDDKPGQVSS